MIHTDQKTARSLLTLPRNEDGFGALVTALKGHREKCVMDFNMAAQRTVFDEKVRTTALTLSGQVKAMNDVIDLLGNLTAGKID